MALQCIEGDQASALVSTSSSVAAGWRAGRSGYGVLALRPRLEGLLLRGSRAVCISNFVPVFSVSGKLMGGCCLVSELQVGCFLFLLREVIATRQNNN
jgi:hypothetical protein